MDWKEVALAIGGAGLLFGAGAIVGGGRRVRVYDWETEWQIAAPLDEVFRILTTPEEQHHWWPSMKVHHVARQAEHPGLGTIVYHVQQAQSVARLVPPFKIIATTNEVEPPQRLRTVVTGDLVGVLDTLLYPQSDGATRIRYHWYVRVRNPLLNLAGFFLTPMFRASHDHVMQEGEAGLQQYCARLISEQAPTRAS